LVCGQKKRGKSRVLENSKSDLNLAAANRYKTEGKETRDECKG
jgi:hypothetical protein